MTADADFLAAWDKYLTAYRELERCNIARGELRFALRDAEFAHQEAKHAYVAARHKLLTLCPSAAFATALTLARHDDKKSQIVEPSATWAGETS